MKISYNWRTILLILGFAVLFTVYNILTTPVVEEEVVEEEFTQYNAMGVSFEAPIGMRFNYSNLGEVSLSYNWGYCYRSLYEHNETHLNYIALTWTKAEPVDQTEMIKLSYNYTDPDNTIYRFGEPVNETLYEHFILYRTFEKQSSEGNRTGYIGVWNCTNSGRVHTLLVENEEGYNRTELFLLFNHTRATTRCHYPGQKPAGSQSVELPFDPDMVMNIAFMIMLTIGFSFTFMMEGFPNFAHTTVAGVGSLVSSYLIRFYGFNSYDTWPFAAFFGGLFGVVLYMYIVKPIRRNGGHQDITLTLTFIIVAMVLPYIFLIFNYWVRYFADGPAFTPSRDFSYNGIPGITIIASAMCILLFVGLRYFLTWNKIGLSLRAVAENPDLAATLGINTERVHKTSWFISGALAALVGCMMSGGRVGGVGGDGMMINVMSGAILGGVYNVYGAILGGVFVALAQNLLKNIAFQVIGLAAYKWQNLFPILFLVITMTIFPDGLTGKGGINRQKFVDCWREINKLINRRENYSL